MNKKEAIKKVEHMGEYERFVDEPISKKSVLNILSQIDEPKKVVVPKVAIEYYEEYKDNLTGFDEWFSDFWDSTFLKEFPQAEQLSEWLYGNDNYTNRQRELALATLIVNGPDAVEIEQEQLYTVEIPNPNGNSLTVLEFISDSCIVLTQVESFPDNWKEMAICQLTESEIKQDFEWAWDAGFAEPVEVEEVK